MTDTMNKPGIKPILHRRQKEKYVKNLLFLPVLILIATSASCYKIDDYKPDSIISPGQAVNSSQLVDLSGDWEKNYQRSDDFETEFKNYVFEIQRQIKELEENRKRNPSFNVDNAITVSRQSIIGLAKFTEEITRMPVLHIVQDKTSVKINRENDFTLDCKFFNKQFSSLKTPYGTENCTWSRGQLFIRINLENGLTIVHQVTLSHDAQELNITTTTASREATVPLIISNYYNRYTQPENDYNCIQTLSRNDVCRKSK